MRGEEIIDSCLIVRSTLELHPKTQTRGRQQTKGLTRPLMRGEKRKKGILKGRNSFQF
jgi:hypothetical protein